MPPIQPVVAKASLDTEHTETQRTQRTRKSN
jgi:hypothetical protein